MNSEIPKHQRAVDALRPTGQRRRYRIKGVPGLHVEVHPSGRSVYQVRYQLGRGRTRRERWTWIGSVDEITLARAVEETKDIRANARLDGRDALTERRAAENPQTLNWLFEQWGGRRGEKTKGWPEIERLWRVDVHPRLGALKAADVTRQDIAKLRDDVGKRSAPMGDRAAALVGRVLNWAVDAGYLEVNPATRLRKIALRKRTGRVLTESDLRTFLTKLRTARLKTHTKTVLLLVALLGQRRTETAHISGAEVRGDIWTIPEWRTKNKQAHVVPLPPWASSIVLSAIASLQGDKTRHLFRGRRGPPSPRAITRAMLNATEEMGIGPFSPHDLRRTMDTGMAALQIPKEIRERVLNHTDDSVEGRHYNRHEYLPEKYMALSAWEERLLEIMASGTRTDC